MKKKRFLTPVLMAPILALLVLFSGGTAFANEVQASLAFNIGYPKGDFDDNLDRNGYGFTMNGGIRLGNSPIILGAEVGFLNYGRDKRYESIYNIPDITVRVINRYNIFQGHVFLRLQPVRGVIRPYVDFLAGINYLWTETSIEDDDGWDDDEITSTNYDDTAFSYGVGGGIMIRIGGRDGGTQFLLDLKTRYLKGGNAEYLQKGSVVVEGQNVTYLVSESKTDLLTMQIGLAISF